VLKEKRQVEVIDGRPIESGDITHIAKVGMRIQDHREQSPMFVTKLEHYISNNSSSRQKHPGVPDGSDGSDGTSFPLTENYTLPVAQVTGRVA